MTSEQTSRTSSRHGRRRSEAETCVARLLAPGIVGS